MDKQYGFLEKSKYYDTDFIQKLFKNYKRQLQFVHYMLVSSLIILEKKKSE